MESPNRIKFHHINKKYKKQTVSLKYCLSRIHSKTKRRKTCKIEFYNYSKYSYAKLREYLSIFLIQISLIVGISAILLGNGDGISGVGQQITYAQLTTSPNGHPEGHPLASPQGYPEGYSERPFYPQVPPYFPHAPSHPQVPPYFPHAPSHPQVPPYFPQAPSHPQVPP